MKKTFFILCTIGFSLAGCMQKSTPETFVLAENGDGPATGESFVLRHGASSKQPDDSLIFPRGKEAKSEHYTGRIFITPGIHKAGYDINHLIFEPGSRNDWHIHPDADQLMLVLDGEGYYQEEGKPKRLVRKSQSCAGGAKQEKVSPFPIILSTNQKEI